jgi:hypothetical protein
MGNPHNGNDRHLGSMGGPVYIPNKPPNARGELLGKSASFFPVRSTALILIEAPSSAYHVGRLALGTQQPQEEETSGDFTLSRTSFMVGSIGRPAPCLSVSYPRRARLCSTATCPLAQNRF